eukprot:TRINITY_DN2827_c0_g2_i2.p1 TRINITY_DN2827_c0_g2~~TRINITY_DN2827_c0_g2_i2.p1  ORF type:complete len:234 (+),score=-6.59 TRINITY_DN2827_c0_g2_i2:179-880(+)
MCIRDRYQRRVHGIRFSIFHGLTEAVIGLILIEQLFRTVTEDSRWNIKPLCLALLLLFAFDVYLFSDAMMFNRFDSDALTVRGFIQVMSIPLLILATERSKDWTSKIRLSQKAAFHSATLLFAGIYLLFMASVGYYVRYFGGEWGRAFQLALLFAGTLLLGVMLVSGSMRAKIKVLVGKHFFRYRYTRNQNLVKRKEESQKFRKSRQDNLQNKKKPTDNPQKQELNKSYKQLK